MGRSRGNRALHRRSMASLGQAGLALESVSARRRSEIMARVRNRDTGPELAVRRLVYGMGYRYRLHSKSLPGRPDLVFRPRRKVIFIHGCFWHRHAKCALARMPKSRLKFWKPKLEGNRVRDERIRRALRAEGWSVLTVWECELARPQRVASKIRRFLDA